jgi:hypothetical protein
MRIAFGRRWGGRQTRTIRVCLGAGALALSPLLLGSCGSSGSPHPAQTQTRGAATGALATITDTAAVSPIATGCPNAALGALEQVASRVYGESATGRIVTQAVQRLESSGALAGAVERAEPLAARRVLGTLMLNQIVSVQVTRNGRTLAKIERGRGIAPAGGRIVGAGGREVGTFTVSVQGANGYAQTVAGLLHVQVVMRSGRRLLSSTLGPTPALRRDQGEVSSHGVGYRVGRLTGSAFPDRPLSISLLVSPTSLAGVCPTSAAPSTSTAAQAQADTFGRVAERVYYAEHEGSKAELLLAYVERSRPFREAVLAGNAAATRAAIIEFFRSHLHIVRVRVIRAGKLLVDVGGPHVLAQILARAFTGAQVLMREGARQVMGTLSPGPLTPPNRGRLVYRGVTYRAYSFDAEAFPSGPLRISLLYPAG